jgi:hypothetical protein
MAGAKVLDWWSHGACRTLPPALFWASRTHAMARHVCITHCSVRDQCEAWAAAQIGLSGSVAGGTLWAGSAHKPGRPSGAQPNPRRDGCPVCQPSETPIDPQGYAANHTRIVGWIAEGLTITQMATRLGAASTAGLRGYLRTSGLTSPRPPQPRPPCGTRAGYQAHGKRKEPPCAKCSEANRVYQVARKRAAESNLPPGSCGTPGGYGRHRRLNEPSCEPCKDAAATYQRDRDRAKRAARAVA